MKRVPDSLWRISIVFVGFVFLVILARFVLLPGSLTDVEAHKLAATAAEANRPIKYAGAVACSDCHEEQPAVIAGGYHSTLSCETCHGPAQTHIDDFEVKPVAPRKREFCPICHTYDSARPTGFPQINPVAHNPLRPCIECHDPHDPRPPETPQECSACHAEIARTKAVSHHVKLSCETCHNAPEEHKVSPRSVRPDKPTKREFCGQCHGNESNVTEALQVDLAEHGGRYLCWQCHYPHQPVSR